MISRRNLIIVASVVIVTSALVLLMLVLTSAPKKNTVNAIPQDVKNFLIGENRIKVNVKDLSYCGIIPRSLTCDVPKPSPPNVTWNVFKGAKSYSLIVMDPDAPMGTFYHLIAYNIKTNKWPSMSALAPNSAGFKGWFPVCPPRGDRPHRYFFIVLALNVSEIPRGLGTQKLLDFIKGHTIAYGFTCGKYKR